MNFNDIIVSYDQVYDTYSRLGVNKQIAEYYARLHAERYPLPSDLSKTIEIYKTLADYMKNHKLYKYVETLKEFNKNRENNVSETLLNIALRVKSCNSFWVFDTYRMQAVKDLKHVNFCHNRFCANCQKLIQASRLYRFSPVIEDLHNQYNLYHIVFTIPNVLGSDLSKSIQVIFNSFKLLIRFFKLEFKPKDINFIQYGYKGALRSTEVTFNPDDFHPHLHCVFAFENDFNEEKYILNSFSFSRGVFQRYFSDFEILLQKIWCLLVKGQKVTLKAINDLEQGYSVVANKICKDDYYEVFKYTFKVTDDKGNFMTYDQFKYIYYALYKRRCIQGYGIFYDLNIEDDFIDDSVDAIYDEFILNLLKIERPVSESLTVPELLELMSKSKFKVISRKNIQRYLIEGMKNESKE